VEAWLRPAAADTTIASFTSKGSNVTLGQSLALVSTLARETPIQPMLSLGHSGVPIGSSDGFYWKKPDGVPITER
jgi:hypothetical protein